MLLFWDDRAPHAWQQSAKNGRIIFMERGMLSCDDDFDIDIDRLRPILLVVGGVVG